MFEKCLDFFINQIGFGYFPPWLFTIIVVILGSAVFCCVCIVIILVIRHRVVVHPPKKPPTKLQAKLAEWDERQREETDDL